MAGTAGFTPSPQMKLQGRAVQQQKQVQRLSQQQIMSLRILAMSSLDLREAVYREVAENPALEIVHDSLADGVLASQKTASASERFSDTTRYGQASAAGTAASDSFQAALENTVDTRETLQAHLEHQFLSMQHTEDEEALGLSLIHNLDANGFHILAPLSLLDKTRPLQTEVLLQQCMDEIRALDPVGTCCSGVEESLFVQAKLSHKAPRAALFLLDGHLPFLNPPQPEKVLKKIQAFLSERRTLSFLSKAEQFWLTETEKNPFQLSELEEAVAFIRTLDPYPARNFSAQEATYVAPDVYVERIPRIDADEKNGIVSPAADDAADFSFKITLSRGNVPTLAVAKDMEQMAGAQSELKEMVHGAKTFIESIQFRENTLFRAMLEIVRVQYRFFEQGVRGLVPLRQKDIAEKIGVHEATVSRLANGKFVQCEQGLFALGYFFTNAVDSGELSKEGAKYEVAEILKAHAADKKPLSDQKISDMLAEKGIKIARRTVAKYRAELNINSSFSR